MQRWQSPPAAAVLGTPDLLAAWRARRGRSLSGGERAVSRSESLRSERVEVRIVCGFHRISGCGEYRYKTLDASAVPRGEADVRIDLADEDAARGVTLRAIMVITWESHPGSVGALFRS